MIPFALSFFRIHSTLTFDCPRKSLLTGLSMALEVKGMQIKKKKRKEQSLLISFNIAIQSRQFPFNFKSNIFSKTKCFQYPVFRTLLACSLIKISVAPCDASTPRTTRSIILSKFGHTSDTIRSILRPSLENKGR